MSSYRFKLLEKDSIKNIVDISYLTLAASVALTVIAIFAIHRHGEQILVDRLRERLIAITATAAQQFNANDIDSIRSEKDLDAPAMKRILVIMNRIRNVNKNLRYIYIWRKTEDPNFLEFVADAEMFSPIDSNANGIIEDEEIPPFPGEKYEVSQIPNAEDIFSFPTAQSEFIKDKWGTFLSGSAPIRNEQGKVVAVLGVDVEVSDFNQIVTAFSWPFITLALLLLGCLVIQTIVLIIIWRGRVQVIQDLDHQKDELLSLVSHQLAKPITAIKWSMESLVDGDSGPLNEKQKEAATAIQVMATDMAELVGMILDVSRVQMGKVMLDPQPLNLTTFFSELLDMARPLAEHRKIEIQSDISPKELPTVPLDRKYTRMVLENLLTNAIKYTPEGGRVRLRVRLEKGWLRCSVSDTGCGIPKSEQSKIFGKMFRASNVRNAKEGNGFGLYIAKGAVEAQGGSIRFESTEGKGTTFYVDLPVQV